MTGKLHTPAARAALGLLLACLGFLPAGAQGADAPKAPNPAKTDPVKTDPVKTDPAKVDPAKVEIHVEHGVALPWAKPGFRIEISGWQPNGDLTLYAVGPDGSKIAIIPEDKAVQADEDGALTVTIDYARKGLIPGHWMFLAAGQPGIHEFETDLPRVEPPTAAHKKWRLDFGKQDDSGKQNGGGKQAAGDK